MEAEHIVYEEVDVGLIQAYLQQLPDKALRFGVRVLLALLVFLIGVQIIKLIRKIVRRSLKKEMRTWALCSFWILLSKRSCMLCFCL